jgi:hypothetical protein
MEHIYEQQHLWDRTPEPSEAEVRDALSPHDPFLWHSIHDPFGELLEYRESDKNFTDLTEEEAAQWLTIQASHRLRALLHGKPGFKLVENYRKTAFIVDEKFVITIKKLTRRSRKPGQIERLMRSNYPTDRNKAYWDQRRGGDLPSIPRVILGYELINEVTEIRIFVAYPRTKGFGVEWAYLMPAQLPLTIMQPTLALVSDSENDDQGFVITGIPDSQSSESEGNAGA